MPSRDPRGYDVDDNATRFSNYFHVLREIVHYAAGWLALEPSFERKYLLGDHMHDDARSLSKIKRRLYELRHPADYPGAPGRELVRMLDRAANAAGPGEFIAVAYGELKPALLHAFDVHLAALDPVVDEPSLRMLRQLERKQRAHVTAAGLVVRNLAHRDLGAFEVDLRGGRRELRVLAPLVEPARDPGVEVTPEGDPYLVEELYVNGSENHVPTEPEEQKHFFHGLMDAELCAAELMARNSHENPSMPLDFHVDMARQTWDELRHARAHDVLMKEELGCRWGDYPVGFSYFKSIYRLDLLGRLALFNSTSEQKAMWRHSHRRKVLVELGQERIARVFDYLLADEVPHVHNGVRWGTWLMSGDEAAYREKVRELRGETDRTGAPAGS
ncbi:MAG: DUF455 family protein [Thermoleophilaceae bacterium]